MWGPGDIGPTSAGQLVNDVARGKLPGLVPGSFSVVDARDVALAQIAAAERGRRGERYLAAGRHMEMGELIPLLGQVAGIPVPTRKLPLSCCTRWRPFRKSMRASRASRCCWGWRRCA